MPSFTSALREAADIEPEPVLSQTGQECYHRSVYLAKSGLLISQ